MTITVGQIAERIGGRVEGDSSIGITGFAGITDAGPGDITFLSNPRYEAGMATTRASAAVVSAQWRGTCPAVLVRVADVEKAGAELLAHFAPPPVRPPSGVHPTVIVGENVKLGMNVGIGPYCVIESGAIIGDRTVMYPFCYIGHEARLGADCLLYSSVNVRERTRVGDRAIIHCGTVIGSDGYGFIPEQKNGKLVIRKIPQTGFVDIGDDVEIGANVTIDRARFGKTRIGNSVKIDNLVHIAHNVTVGDCTGIVAQAGISGSSSVGSGVLLYGQAGVAGHLKIGDGAVVGAQAGVTKDVAPGSYVSGYPAMPHEKAAFVHASLMRLPALKERFSELERRVAAIEGNLGASRSPGGDAEKKGHGK